MYSILQHIFLRALTLLWLGCGPLFGMDLSLGPSESKTKPLDLAHVLKSIYDQYPPYLAMLIERDVAQGKLRSARGAFDFQTFARIFDTRTGFYESTTFEAGFEQFLGIWGSTLFGGYLYTDGILPDYYQKRTDGGGTPQIGIRLPLMQNRSIDKQRTQFYKARLDREKAEPSIQKQQLYFTKAAMLAYYNWLATGQKLLVSEELLRLALDRAGAISTQISKGLVAPVTELENNQLVASRELSILKARREFEAASIALSLFYRNETDQPTLAGRSQLPVWFAEPMVVDNKLVDLAMELARQHRPELTAMELELQKLDLDVRLFKNQMLPKLDAFLSASQGLGEPLYKDTGELELKFGLEFRQPIQRNEAKGKMEVTRAKIDQIQNQLRFAANQISAEILNAYSAVSLALGQVTQARRNADLASQLLAVERDRFNLGATDLLALQIREQSLFNARIGLVESLHEYYKSLSDFVVSSAVSLAIPEGAFIPDPLIRLVDHLGIRETDLN